MFKLTSVCLARFFEYRCVRMPQYAVDENMTVVEVEVEGELAPVFIMPTPLRINHTYSMVSQLPAAKYPASTQMSITNSAANRSIGEVVQSRRRPLLGPSLG